MAKTMERTRRPGRAPQFGDMSFALAGTPQANFGPASWERQPEAVRAPQAAMPATGGGKFVPSDKATFFLEQWQRVPVGTPMSKLPQIIQAIEDDYRQQEAQRYRAFIDQRRHALDQLKHQQTLDAAAEDKRQFGVTEGRLQAESNWPTRDVPPKPLSLEQQRAKHVAAIVEAKVRQGMPLPQAINEAYPAVSMQGGRGGAIEQKPISDTVLQNLAELGYTGAEKGLTPDQTRRQRLQGLAGDLLSERVEKGLAKIRRPAAAKQPELPLRGHPATQPKQPQAKAPAADRKWGPGTGRRLVLVPGFPEPQTIPDNQLHDFLDSVPGAKLLE